MTVLQLNPTIPMETPLGSGQAILVIDYSSEHHLIWTIIIDSTGEIWSFPNPKVRGQKNITMNRELIVNSTNKMHSIPTSALHNM